MSQDRGETKSYRNEAIKAATDLGYGTEVVKKLKAAKTDSEIERIIINARRQKWG